MVSKAESHIPEPDRYTIGFSTSVTSSPNGSFEAAAGGSVFAGACAVAGERTVKLSAAAAATDKHQRREGIIGFSPESPPLAKPATDSPAAIPIYTMHGPAGDLLLASL